MLKNKTFNAGFGSITMLVITFVVIYLKGPTALIFAPPLLAGLMLTMSHEKGEWGNVRLGKHALYLSAMVSVLTMVLVMSFKRNVAFADKLSQESMSLFLMTSAITALLTFCLVGIGVIRTIITPLNEGKNSPTESGKVEIAANLLFAGLIGCATPIMHVFPLLQAVENGSQLNSMMTSYEFEAGTEEGRFIKTGGGVMYDLSGTGEFGIEWSCGETLSAKTVMMGRKQDATPNAGEALMMRAACERL